MPDNRVSYIERTKNNQNEGKTMATTVYNVAVYVNKCNAVWQPIVGGVYDLSYNGKSRRVEVKEVHPTRGYIKVWDFTANGGVGGFRSFHTNNISAMPIRVG